MRPLHSHGIKNLSLGQTLALALSLVLSIGRLQAQAQDSTCTRQVRSAPEGYTSSFGVSLSPTAYGLLFRHWTAGPVGYEVTLLPVVLADKNGSSGIFSAGAAGLFSFNRKSHSNIYSYLGGQYLRSLEAKPTTYFTSGLGVGLEYSFRNVLLALRGGFGYWSISDSSKAADISLKPDFGIQWSVGL